MHFYKKPWLDPLEENAVSYDLTDSLNGVKNTNGSQSLPENVPILSSAGSQFVLFPYPKKGHAEQLGIHNFPVRHRGQKVETDFDHLSFQLTAEMHEIIARVQELEQALDDPANVWKRLREAWLFAEDNKKPKMSEIVKQASELAPHIRELEKKIRRILRRDREKIQLDRVQEMDRASMRWLSKQPGKDLAQRAGADQRILAITRKENFDTVENRVLHSYVLLAERVSRVWLDEHPNAKATNRYALVEKLRTITQNFAKELKRLGVGFADANITPNYVLMQDKNYKEIYNAWQRLINRDLVEDELWAWQGEIWTDFCALAIVLSMNDLPEAELIAQAPIVWNDTSDHGRWFFLHQPLAIFWLRDSKRIVEVFSRPQQRKTNQITRAVISLKISDQDGDGTPREVLVWTPHNLRKSDFKKDATEAAKLIGPLPSYEGNVKSGLILVPSHGEYEHCVAQDRGKQVDLIALSASGVSLGRGMHKIAEILRLQ